eukprot:TRINITY_DN320_c0_g1_i1.p1 TRINITY_DN320_c0_g1~~TRINITY_DN320_c0_g1_i1.p1  ORF type:complete len:242 (+),score=50.43 TRINITY_DN320_c0_g1_i1:50-727(+)
MYSLLFVLLAASCGQIFSQSSVAVDLLVLPEKGLEDAVLIASRLQQLYKDGAVSNITGFNVQSLTVSASVSHQEDFELEVEVSPSSLSSRGSNPKQPQLETFFEGALATLTEGEGSLDNVKVQISLQAEASEILGAKKSMLEAVASALRVPSRRLDLQIKDDLLSARQSCGEPACSVGTMRCSSNNSAFQTCSYVSGTQTGWTAEQPCQAGLRCYPNGNSIYCSY